MHAGKLATLDNGKTLPVPSFIKEGDTIMVSRYIIEVAEGACVGLFGGGSTVGPDT
jgi:hypothetical protein